MIVPSITPMKMKNSTSGFVALVHLSTIPQVSLVSHASHCVSNETKQRIRRMDHDRRCVILLDPSSHTSNMKSSIAFNTSLMASNCFYLIYNSLVLRQSFMTVFFGSQCLPIIITMVVIKVHANLISMIFEIRDISALEFKRSCF